MSSACPRIAWRCSPRPKAGTVEARIDADYGEIMFRLCSRIGISAASGPVVSSLGLIVVFQYVEVFMIVKERLT